MRLLGTLCFGVLLALLINTGTTVADEPISLSEKAALQAVMQRHIDRQLVDGAYLHLDLRKGDVRALYPVKAHPEILRMGPYLVLCSDFRDKGGRSVNIDFYVARGAAGYVVFHAAVDDRDRLMALFKSGKVSRLN